MSAEDFSQHVIKEWRDDSQQSKKCQQRPEHRADFILESPYEIASLIVSYLSIGNVRECTKVSQRWYDRLVKLHVPWETMAVSNDEITSDYLLLRDVSQYVKKLSLYGMSPKLMRYIELVEPDTFPNLQSLALVTSAYDMGVIDLRTYVYDTLAYIAHSLEHLCIRELATKMAFSLNTILQSYSNLSTLQLHAWNIFDYPISQTTRLASIDLAVGVEDMRYDIRGIQSLFQHAPQLQHLKLHYFTMQRYDIASILKDYCPNLTTIIVNQHHFEGTFKLNLRPKIAEQNSSLQCLIVKPLASPHLLVPRLKRSADTLETMCLAPVDAIPPPDWRQFSTVALPKLTFLQINLFFTSAEFVRDHLTGVLRCSPTLKTLILEQFMDHGEGAATNDAFDTMMQLPQLSTLRLALFDIRGDGFPQFLRHHARYDGSSLHELSIYSCCGLSKNVLQVITRLRKLKELALKDVGHDVEQSDFREFMESASQSMVQLSMLKLEVKHFDDVRVAEATRKFKNLSSVAFT